MKKGIKIVLVSFVGIVITACSTSNETKEFNEKTSGELNGIASKQLTESKKENYPEPSKMALITSDGLYKMKRGAFSWSVFNNKTKETKTTHVDIVGPLGSVTLNDALPLTVSEEITFNFEFEPYRLEINIWEQDGTSSTYSSISDIQERGKYVVEFIAFYEQGTVTYVNAFDLK